jgi:hypothetical protein
MPHYFFNLIFGDRVSADEEGTELHDQRAAREEAFAIIRELSDPALGGNPRRWAGWVMQVADKAGPFMRAPIGHPALEIVTRDWQPASKRPAASLPTAAAAGTVDEPETKRNSEADAGVQG